MTMRFLFRLPIPLLGLLMGGIVSAQVTETWTLERSLSEAARNSNRLRASAQQVQAARASARDANASQYPKLEFGGAYNYTSKVAALDIAFPNGPAIHRELGVNDAYDLALTARAPIYSGGSLTERTRAEESAARAAEHDLATDSLRLAYDVRRAFFAALGAAKRAETAQQSVNRLDRHLKELQGAKEAGMASDEMIIQTEAQVRQAEESVLNAEAEAKTARMAFANLVGRPGEEISPADELETTLAPVEAMSSQSRTDVAAMTARIEQTEHLTRAARGGFLPTLSAQAAYHYAKPGVDALRNQWMYYGTVGANLAWTLWDWNSRAAKVAQARAGMKTLEARKDELLQAIDTRLATSRETMEAAQAARDKATARVELERRRFELVQGRYRVGSTSESEFLDAQDDLTAAELDRSAAAVKLRLAEADWINAAGR